MKITMKIDPQPPKETEFFSKIYGGKWKPVIKWGLVVRPIGKEVFCPLEIGQKMNVNGDWFEIKYIKTVKKDLLWYWDIEMWCVN